MRLQVQDGNDQPIVRYQYNGLHWRTIADHFAGDINGDGAVDFQSDVQTILDLGSRTPALTIGDAEYQSDADVNYDGQIDFWDIQLVLNDFGKTATGISQSLDAGGPGNPLGYAGYLFIEDFGAASTDLGQQGHWYARHRFYDPVAGRWLTRDPAGYVDGMSLYLYVGGNPFAYMDPTGLGKLGFFEFVGMLFTEPEVQRSAAQGAAIGAKAVGNAAVDTVVSTATLGTVDNLEVIPVSADEREFYDSSYAVSRVGTEIIGGVATAGAGKAAQAGGKGLQVASHGIEALEIGQSAVMSGRGLVDVAQNGLDARNGAQVVGGVLGLRAATSLPRTGEITGAFNASSKVASTTEALPIYPVSRARMPRIAENIEHAQLARHPAELTRASPGVIDTNRKLATSGVPRGIGSVDEYPFASTIEGGRGAWVGHVPRTEQYSQGGTLSNFYRTNGIEPGMKFKVVICD